MKKYYISERRINSFIRGMSKNVNIFGSSNRNPRKHTSDRQAMRSDWQVVGNEIKKAMTNVER